MNEMFSTHQLQQTLRGDSVPELAPIDIQQLMRGATRRWRARVASYALTACALTAGAVMIVSNLAGSPAPDVVGSGTPVEYSFEVGSLAPMVCGPTEESEIGSPSYESPDGEVDPVQPLERIELLLEGEIIHPPPSPVIVDDSALDDRSGTVLVGSEVGGATAEVAFVNTPSGWQIETISQCVPST
jgi:hypothetical protein